LTRLTTSILGGHTLGEWGDTADTGDGGTTVPLLGIYFDFSDNEGFSGATSILLGPGEIGARTREFGSSDGLTITKGEHLYVRARAVNLMGNAPQAHHLDRIIVSEPGVPVSVSMVYNTPLSLNVTWGPPDDAGAGSGVQHPIDAYQVAFYTYSGAPNPADPSTIVTMVRARHTKALELFFWCA
jgi:hypothetical protein